MKGYIARWAFEGEGDVRYWFSRSPEAAATWAFRDVAEVHMREFNQRGVTIPSSAGDTHTIRNFSIDQRPDGKFVLGCDAPFLVPDLPVQAGRR